MNKNSIHQIEGLLTRDTRINLTDCDISITGDNGTAVLRGTVPNVAAKRLAPRLATQASGVWSVRDELRVATVNPMGDVEIAEHVRRSFIDEKNIEENQITFDTDPLGGITLKGRVRSLAQKRLCEVLCWWVKGVTDVHNELEVQPFEEDNDEELKDNLMVIMEKDFLVNPKKFAIDIKDRMVTLRGQVNSETEKDAAEQDCWYTPGVLDVSNELSIA